MKIANFLFLITGTKFYFEWLLLTNPTSKNSFIKSIWGWNKKGYPGYKPRQRLIQAWFLGVIHLILWLVFVDCCFYGGYSLLGLIGNVYVNLYPTFVQIYIGYRCHRLIKKKASAEQQRLLFIGGKPLTVLKE